MLSLCEVFDAAAALGFEVVLFEDRVADAEAELRAWAALHDVPLIDDTHIVPPPHPHMHTGLWVSVLRAARPAITVHRSQSRRPR